MRIPSGCRNHPGKLLYALLYEILDIEGGAYHVSKILVLLVVRQRPHVGVEVPKYVVIQVLLESEKTAFPRLLTPPYAHKRVRQCRKILKYLFD